MIAIVLTIMAVLFGICAVLGILALCLGITAFWIWMLVDAIRNDQLQGWHRVLWAVLIWFTHIIGAVIYFIFGKRCAVRTA
jgi:hypothetical protein